MTKASRTRQFIIDKTAPVFNRGGFAGTSLQDLTNATGLSKGALYGNFSSKEDIAQAVFVDSMEKVRTIIRGRLDKATSNKKKLNALFDFYGQFVFTPPIPGGCPLMNMAVEADDASTFMKKTVAHEFKRTTDFIAGILENGIKTGEFRSDIKANELAFVFFSAIEGAIVISRISSSDAAIKAVVTHCKIMVEQISL